VAAHPQLNLLQTILGGIATVLFAWPFKLRWPIAMIVLVGGSFAALSIRNLEIGDFGRGSPEPLGLSLGLDLVGGIHLVYQAGEEGFEPSDDQMAGLIANITRRINSLGVAEPSIQKLGSDRLVIQLPGLEDEEQAKKLIGRTSQLEIVERICTISPCNISADVETPGAFQNQLTGLTGADMTRAFAGTDATTNEPILQFELNRGAAQQFATLTARLNNSWLNTDTPDELAFILDDEIIVSAVVTSPILAGAGRINGDFTFEEARLLAIQVESGRLPIPITELSSDFVAASLGADSLDQALQAGLVGLALVLFFMIAYYRISGLVAAITLIFYTAMVLAIFKLIPVTLTLAGLAGFILSLGMAVDANILIFERMKEEIRIGRSLQFATQIGFNRAWTSIRDGNISTLIIAAILFFFGSSGANSAVTGFAIALAIGVGTSMFTAIVISKKMLSLVVATQLRKWPRAFSPEVYKGPSASANHADGGA
jgi:preprotein translocase subunit SecD